MIYRRVIFLDTMAAGGVGSGDSTEKVRRGLENGEGRREWERRGRDTSGVGGGSGRRERKEKGWFQAEKLALYVVLVERMSAFLAA